MAVTSGLDADELGDDDAEGGSEDSLDKNSHRGIPAWEDAIGVIIAVNMESRAKNPKGSGQRPRGRGRGRGGSRGGQDRRGS